MWFCSVLSFFCRSPRYQSESGLSTNCTNPRHLCFHLDLCFRVTLYHILPPVRLFAVYLLKYCTTLDLYNAVPNCLSSVPYFCFKYERGYQMIISPRRHKITQATGENRIILRKPRWRSGSASLQCSTPFIP
jgi:hypothetical protein